jgi:zinc protease
MFPASERPSRLVRSRLLPPALLRGTNHAPLSPAAPRRDAGLAQDNSIPCQTFTLDNGLTVIVHEDHSDPVVAVYVQFHVGSAREVRGRSGFAHLFEHMLFQGSEHVGDDQHFKLVQGAGGTLNGSTNNDRTNYFEVLPSNQLELALWLESDRMGFLLPAVTQAKLDNQRDVVKNERRQNYENRPYAQGEGVICAALYPPEHPYSWITIGSQEDLTAATLEDVKGFFKTWYGAEQRHAGGRRRRAIRAGQGARHAATSRASIRARPCRPPSARPAHLAASSRLVLEDQRQAAAAAARVAFGRGLPRRRRAARHAGGRAGLEQVVGARQGAHDRVQEARSVSASNESQELAGTFNITLQPNPGVTLDTLNAKTRALLGKLAADGIDPAALARAKTVYEARFVRRMETVGFRTSMLGLEHLLTAIRNYHVKAIAAHLAVTPADCVRVLKSTCSIRPCLELSTVPEGKQELAAKPPSAETMAKEVARPKPAPYEAPSAETAARSWTAPSLALDRTHKRVPPRRRASTRRACGTTGSTTESTSPARSGRRRR